MNNSGELLPGRRPVNTEVCLLTSPPLLSTPSPAAFQLLVILALVRCPCWSICLSVLESSCPISFCLLSYFSSFNFFSYFFLTFSCHLFCFRSLSSPPSFLQNFYFCLFCLAANVLKCKHSKQHDVRIKWHIRDKVIIQMAVIVMTTILIILQ